MMYHLLRKLDHKVKFSTAAAHCDIPCKIYDPISAQIAVLTMIRLVDLLNDLQEKLPFNLEDNVQFIRLVAQKELHGSIVKEEISVIWGDYIKEPQLEKYPELHRLVHNIMMETSKAKQNVDKAITLSLLAKVNRFADIFWQSKGQSTFVAQCPYPPAQLLVYPLLNA
ncbi:MAG: nickel superoxide dismutase [Colwellia sp.]|jgi:nickel superoxide dismutase